MILISVLLLWPLAAAIAGRHAVPPHGTNFVCTPVAVWDGDGPLWCAEGPRIRLANINARELDGSCRRHASCVATSGIAARDALIALLGGPRGGTRDGHVMVVASSLRCRSIGADRYGRTLATCANRTGDLGDILIAKRMVSPWRK